MGQFTKESILHYLDNCIIDNPGFDFIDLDHGYFYTANSRLSLFADENDWAIVFEKSGYSNRGSRIDLQLNYFGSTLQNLPKGGRCNTTFIELVSDESLNEIEITFEEVSPEATRVRIGGSDFSFHDLARFVTFEYEAECRATLDELRTCLPGHLPLIMHIDSWHYRKYSSYGGLSGPAPSSYETFQLIADVLVSHDPSRFQPTLPPNNHWMNWPEAGTL